MFFKLQPVHFVGIGGIGMSGLAEILLGMGYPVSGSDLHSSAITEGLARRGALIREGHSAQNLGDAKAVVFSSAVPAGSPELAEARRRGIPVIPRGELLAELMRIKFGIAVAGSHGKTTTTSMIAAIMTHAGLDPTVVVGGRVGMMGGANARLGKSDYLVVESDESDGSFLKLAPIVAVVTNIDREHLDHYAGLDEIRHAFAAFVGKIPFYGAAVLCLDDENIQRILPAVNRRVITYGTSSQADLRVTHSAAGHMASQFQLAFRGDDLGCFRLHIPGAHNALNAAAAATVGLELEIPVEEIREALERFTGVERRFQIRGAEAGITVIDDYGHHPTEIQATLAAARACRFRRVLVLFQPHRYTRTQALLDAFARAFHQADSVFVLDIYGASEKPIEGVNSRLLVDRIRAFGHRDAHYAGPAKQGEPKQGAAKQGEMDAGIAAVIEEAREGDAIITLGAGNISQAGATILEQLRGRASGGTGPERPPSILGTLGDPAATGSVVPLKAPKERK